MSIQEFDRIVVSRMWVAAWYSSIAAWAFPGSISTQHIVDPVDPVWLDWCSYFLVFSKTVAKGQGEILWDNSCVYRFSYHFGVLGREECDLG